MRTPVILVAGQTGTDPVVGALLRTPGTLVVEFLDPLPPGLAKDEYIARVRTAIEDATGRIVEAGRKEQEQLIGSAPSYAAPSP